MLKIACYRRKSDGRILVNHPNGYTYIAATPTLPTIFNSGYHTIGSPKIYESSVYYGIDKDLLEMEDLVDLKWIHPHLLKPIKEQLKQYLK